jgi:hypothetical protein
MRRQPRSRFLRSIIKTSEQMTLEMPWTRARPPQPAAPKKIVQFRRA